MAINAGLTLFRLTRILSPSYVQTLSRCTNKATTRLNSTKSSSKILEHLNNRSLIKISGAESTDFLQGLVTNDMKHFDDGAANIYTLFLNIKGRVMCESIIYKSLDKTIFYIECDTRVSNVLLKHLKMYKIRRKVDIESLENKMKVWSMFDASSVITRDDREDYELNERNLEGQIFPCGTLTNNKSTKLIDDIMIYEDPRIPEMSMRVLSNENVAKEEIIKHLGNDVTTENSTSYRKFRYRFGIGEGIDDLPIGKALPLEINCDYLHGVSFHKGCYIGQELTARTHHTGVVRKRLMPLLFEDCADKTFNYDDGIVDESGKVVGKFRGKEGTFGLGLMRITEALAARTININDCRVTVTKPRWWPKEAQKTKVNADTGK